MKIQAILLLACATAICAATPVKMDATQKKKFNTFFSNFSEASVASFKPGSLSDTAMLKFALSHLYINTPKSLKKTADENSVSATAAQVDTATMKYFGKRIVTHRVPSYVIEEASGEMFIFSQIDTLETVDESTFHATGMIYTTSSGGTPDVHATPAAWKRDGEEVTESGKFDAHIKNDGGRYILLDYTVTES